MTATPEAMAKFIGLHHPAACVEVGERLTVCSVWTRGKRWGWTIERIPADWRSVREWLGY